MASSKSCFFTLVLVVVLVKKIHCKEYVLARLNECNRVPQEAPCNISFDYFVPNYASERYEILMETIYRRAKDISRLDSRSQCVDAYKSYLCSLLFPQCSKHSNPRYQNLEIQRWIIHDPGIRVKCMRIFAMCNSRVAQRFMGSDFFLCDHLTYPPLGWESDRCVPYDLDTRCGIRQYGKLPLWYLNYHDQNLVQYLNVTLDRLKTTLSKSCRLRIRHILCRHPSCGEHESDDGDKDKSKVLVVNYTRQECSWYLECARFVPGEVNVDAICLMFPSSAHKLMSSLVFVAIALLLHGLNLRL